MIYMITLHSAREGNLLCDSSLLPHDLLSSSLMAALRQNRYEAGIDIRGGVGGVAAWLVSGIQSAIVTGNKACYRSFSLRSAARCMRT